MTSSGFDVSFIPALFPERSALIALVAVFVPMS